MNSLVEVYYYICDSKKAQFYFNQKQCDGDIRECLDNNDNDMMMDMIGKL